MGKRLTRKEINKKIKQYEKKIDYYNRKLDELEDKEKIVIGFKRYD